MRHKKNECSMFLHDVRTNEAFTRHGITSQKTRSIDKQPRIHPNSHNIKLPAINGNGSWDVD